MDAPKMASKQPMMSVNLLPLCMKRPAQALPKRFPTKLSDVKMVNLASDVA